ncbi:MAG: hypothetical protein JNL58_09820 [Planctomyces sp.]|nr:hypothetical protein [Planctomyces sp.]
MSTLHAQEPYSGIDPDGFDSNVRVQDDLFQHVNGRWLLTTDIPGDKSNYGSFTALDDMARENIRIIIEESAENPTDENAQKIGDFYRSYMNEEIINARGIEPLKEELAAIDAVSSTDQLIQLLGTWQSKGLGGPIGFFVSTDAKNSSRYLAAVSQSGTTLPDRDYYLKDDDRYQAARSALKSYIAKLHELAGLSDGPVASEAVLALETKLAQVQWDRTELRNAEKRYNLFEVSRLPELTPEMAWKAFFESAGVADLSEVNVATPSYFQGLEKILAEVPVADWKHYLRFQLLDSAANYLSKDWVDASFEFHGKTLTGVPEQQPRWKRAVDACSGAGAGDFGVLGEAVGQVYVARHFRPEAKHRMDQLVANLLKTYETSIHELKWMTDATKVQALDKLHKMTPKIGYTEKWRDYSNLEIKPDDLLGNMQRSAAFEYKRMIDRLGKPVDRTEWGMTPQTVNAYYNASKNEIVFPAAILQPPFFDAQAEDAVNYGGIGAVIGHEISHGFDDQGSKYDGDGNLRNWWTDEDRAAFEKLTSALVKQYEGYEAMPGKNLNGRLTLGENIADLSGMAIAFKAYKLSLNGKPGPVIENMTAEQRFFLGWSQIWRRKYRDEELVRRLVVDPHSPSAFRANGPVTNLDAFYEAFNVQPGDKLYKAPSERIQIW